MGNVEVVENKGGSLHVLMVESVQMTAKAKDNAETLRARRIAEKQSGSVDGARFRTEILKEGVGRDGGCYSPLYYTIRVVNVK